MWAARSWAEGSKGCESSGIYFRSLLKQVFFSDICPKDRTKVNLLNLAWNRSGNGRIASGATKHGSKRKQQANRQVQDSAFKLHRAPFRIGPVCPPSEVLANASAILVSLR